MENITAACIGQLQALRVFVVESHPDTLACYSLYLKALGHVVTLARNVTEALASWPLVEHDMLISDLRLPDGDGWELLSQLIPRPRYAIAITGLGMVMDRDRSRAAGFRHHLLKPFKLADFDAILQEAAQETAHAQRITDIDAA